MIRRAGSLILLVWLLGFILFAVTLPGPAANERSDGVAVLTGGDGRILRGLEVLAHGEAPRMLVSGVDPEVRTNEFAGKYHVPAATMACCVTLGAHAFDTRSNATEVADWVAANHIHSLRLVTSDWHMRRAAYEVRRALPPGVMLIEDGVPGHPALRTLFLEYNKLLARRLFLLWPK